MPAMVLSVGKSTTLACCQGCPAELWEARLAHPRCVGWASIQQTACLSAHSRLGVFQACSCVQAFHAGKQALALTAHVKDSQSICYSQRPEHKVHILQQAAVIMHAPPAFIVTGRRALLPARVRTYPSQRPAGLKAKMAAYTSAAGCKVGSQACAWARFTAAVFRVKQAETLEEGCSGLTWTATMTGHPTNCA